MAGDYIQIRNDLDDDPHVIKMVELLNNQDVDLIIGKLRRLWKYADRHTVDGFIRFATPQLINSVIVQMPGFAEAAAAVGWLEFTNDGAQVPRFEEYNSQSAKKRAQTARRVAKHRGKKGCNADSVTGALQERYTSNDAALAKEEKSIEEKKNPPSPLAENPKPAERQPPPDPEVITTYGEVDARLAQKWCFRYRGTVASERNPYQVAETISEWRESLGLTEAEIERAIDAKRDRTEPTWRMKDRLMAQKPRAPNPSAKADSDRMAAKAQAVFAELNRPDLATPKQMQEFAQSRRKPQCKPTDTKTDQTMAAKPDVKPPEP